MNIEALREAAERRETQPYVLRLFVCGATRQSALAIRSVQAICERYLKDRHKLDIVDIYQQPAEAVREQIVAVPTLLKKGPEPLRRLIGAMSDEARVLQGLGLAHFTPGAAG